MTEVISAPNTICRHARMLAISAHHGEDHHLIRVAAGLDHPLDRAVAWLHNTIQGTEWTRRQLDDQARWLSAAEALIWRGVVADVALLTRPPGMSDMDYVTRVQSSPRARRVRLACLADTATPVT